MKKYKEKEPRLTGGSCNMGP